MTPDIADIIAGELGVSRGTAYDMMREALEEAQPAPVSAQVLGFDVVLDESLPPNKMKFVQPAPVQEPVAYIRVSKTGHVMACAETGDFYALAHGTKLYTTPPAAQRQWVGLSDLNIDELENEYMKSAQTAHQFLRAIEAKLKERNQ
jgi:hypothetical protein